MPGIFISEQVSLVFRQRSLSWWSSTSGRSATMTTREPALLLRTSGTRQWVRVVRFLLHLSFNRCGHVGSGMNFPLFVIYTFLQ